MTNERRPKRRFTAQGWPLLLIAGIAIVDLGADLQEGTSAEHLFTEAAILFFALAGLVAVLRSLRQENRTLKLQAEQLASSLALESQESARWRKGARALIDGLGAAIEDQFNRWALSPAEKEVALLLLKGLTHKEVASTRGIGEPTTRQQARAVYKKAGLTGRHDLSAFFLEDLLLPSSLDPDKGSMRVKG